MRILPALFIVFVIASIGLAVTELNGCRDLDSFGETYVVNREHFSLLYTGDDWQDYCFKITANDVTLDCQGHTVFLHRGFHQMIYLEEVSGVTVKNCIFENVSRGIKLLDSDNNVFGSRGTYHLIS